MIKVYEEHEIKFDFENEMDIAYPTFDRIDDTFKYVGSYSDHKMETANEFCKAIFHIGERTYELIKDGRIKNKHLVDELFEDGFTYENDTVLRVYGFGFYSIRTNKLLRDDLYNTSASEKIYNQMFYWKDKCYDELAKNLEKEVSEKDEISI